MTAAASYSPSASAPTMAMSAITSMLSCPRRRLRLSDQADEKTTSASATANIAAAYAPARSRRRIKPSATAVTPMASASMTAAAPALTNCCRDEPDVVKGRKRKRPRRGAEEAPEQYAELKKYDKKKRPSPTFAVSCTGTATVTCTYTGAGSYTFMVPAGVSSLDVIAVGANGGLGFHGGAGAVGASVEDMAVPVSGGEALAVVVGGVGADGVEKNGGAAGARAAGALGATTRVGTPALSMTAGEVVGSRGCCVMRRPRW